MKVTRTGYILIGTLVALYAMLSILYVLTQLAHDSGLVRFFGSFGITSLFIASIMSAFLRQVYKALGVAFLKLHHLFAIAGLVLVTLHPVSLAFMRGIQVFVPDFSSWYSFWSLAGRPALYVIYGAVTAVLLKRLLKKSWRIFHALLYVALLFGVVHGVLLGPSFANPVIDGTYIVLLAILGASFIYKNGRKIANRLRLAPSRATKAGGTAGGNTTRGTTGSSKASSTGGGSETGENSTP